MRQCIGGDGSDTTAAALAYLTGTVNPLIRHIYLIGEPEHPQSLRLCDHEGPVIYDPWGKFSPAVVAKDSITTKVGLDVQQTTVTWTPGDLSFSNFTSNIETASPLQLARLHFYDNWPIRIWKIFMPTPGDANTLGGCAWFGGRIGSCVVGRNQLQFQINSFLDVVTQKVPPNVIESTSTLSGFTAATVPPGDASIPIFNVYTGSTTNNIIANCTSPTSGKIYSGNLFVGGYMVFLSGPGATLAGIWSAIGQNGAFTDGSGNHHSEFGIYSPLPWAPTPVSGGSGDTFYVSTAAPINLADGDYYGFPFVPNPSQAV